jgi:hypothetical protein
MRLEIRVIIKEHNNQKPSKRLLPCGGEAFFYYPLE